MIKKLEIGEFPIVDIKGVGAREVIPVTPMNAVKRYQILDSYLTFLQQYSDALSRLDPDGKDPDGLLDPRFEAGVVSMVEKARHGWIGKGLVGEQHYIAMALRRTLPDREIPLRANSITQRIARLVDERIPIDEIFYDPDTGDPLIIFAAVAQVPTKNVG